MFKIIQANDWLASRELRGEEEKRRRGEEEKRRRGETPRTAMQHGSLPRRGRAGEGEGEAF